ncbi:hypothetical protein BOW39_04430 [Solemya velum gill symbiont]|uniref:ArnT family glycosyltransferase n=1 Tax=Solemya velum gill symbiont TaxID=2340 RepID=UPI0009966DD5|nr:glycosyltransferase family 39 protein [Solemya velum gill symbiont]OOZ49953.1 hypothetical protein BOW39_04430 [Solemya velum gill symbiont]
MTSERNSFAWLLLFIAGITAYRFFALLGYDYALYTDEAYYWLWSKELEWGYYSKPPVIALLIRAATSVCGDAEVCIRSIGIILYPFTALGIYLTGKTVANSRVGLWAAVLFITMPAVSVSSLTASTDIPLLLLWSWSLFFFIKALDGNNWSLWILLGIAGGIGMLSKYNFAIFFISGLLLMGIVKTDRHHLLSIKPWLAVLIAFLVFLPNLVWNFSNDFPTITHTSEISGVLSESFFHWDSLGGFLLSQFIIFGIISFGVLLTLLTRNNWLQETNKIRLLYMGLPFLLLISGIALFGKSNENWASPTYVAGSLLVAWWLYDKGLKKLLYSAVLLNLVLMVVSTHLDTIKTATGIENTSANDPFKRLRGWREFAAQVDERLSPDMILVSPSRTLLSHYLYEAKQPTSRSASWNPKNRIRSHFDLVRELKQDENQTYLLLKVREDDCLAGSFDSIEPQPPIKVDIYDNYSIEASVALARGFKGYQCQ